MNLELLKEIDLKKLNIKDLCLLLEIIKYIEKKDQDEIEVI